MLDTIDYSDVSYMQEILGYFPINSEGNEDIYNYIQNIADSIAVNYKYEKYQFSYFGVHLLYMTYIYCTIWKIGKMEPDRYQDAIIFARSYGGRESDLQIEDAESIFVYSLMPEKDIAKLFKIIALDKSQVNNICLLVKARDEMAHASGNFEILTEEIFESKMSNIYISMKNIQRCMDKCIKKWYTKLLLDFCRGKYQDYKKPQDFIIEYMTQIFKLSAKELLVCSGMSVRELIAKYPEYKSQFENFKKVLQEYCEDIGCM